ncbi:MAG: metallophosphoesterase [Steroidobacteraceae bacterium]
MPRCLSQVTSDLAVGLGPDVVAGLGDYQYEDAKADSYRSQYDPGWGRLRDITRPALGNQEYKVHAANTFFAYFGDQAGPRSGWYSYDVGSWHVVVLNSNCDLAGGCGPDSPQVQWLRDDLAAHDGTRCTLAYWHHPRFSTGLHGSDARSATFWEVLAAHHADVVLAAHEHDYQRFEPVNPTGGSDPQGIRSFVVGTGGQATYAPDETTGEAGRRRAAATTPTVRVDDTVGVLGLTLDPEGYRWRFVDATGATRDQGTAACQ